MHGAEGVLLHLIGKPPFQELAVAGQHLPAKEALPEGLKLGHGH